MRTARWLPMAAALAALASLPLAAQEASASASQSVSASAAGTHVNQSSNSAAQANVNHEHVNASEAAADSSRAQSRYSDAGASGDNAAAARANMRPVSGELERKLDSKTARVGEPVVLKTTKKMRTAGGIVIPSGSRLVGHVTEVQPHTRRHQPSSLGIAFDRVELKNGQSFAIRSVIASVSPSPASLEAASFENENAFAGPAGGGMAAGGGAMGGGSAAIGRASGGLIGGGAGMVGGATSNLGRVGSGLASTAGGTMNAGDNGINAAGDLAGGASGDLHRGLGGSAGAVGSLGAHATEIPGVMLDSSVAGSASGMLLAARQNVQLESGTRMVLDLAAAK